MQIDEAIEFELAEQTNDGFGCRTHHIGHFFAGKGNFQDFFGIQSEGIHEDQENLGQSFANGFLGDIGNEIIGFAEFAAGKLHELHGEGRVFPDQLEKVFRRDKAEHGILDYFGGCAGEFLAEYRAKTDDVATLGKPDNLFFAVDACFVYLDDSVLHTIEAVDPVALMVNDVSPFVEAAAFAVMNRIELFRCQVFENGMTFDDALVTNGNMWNAFHTDKYKNFRQAVYNYVT